MLLSIVACHSSLCYLLRWIVHPIAVMAMVSRSGGKRERALCLCVGGSCVPETTVPVNYSSPVSRSSSVTVFPNQDVLEQPFPSRHFPVPVSIERSVAPGEEEGPSPGSPWPQPLQSPAVSPGQPAGPVSRGSPSASPACRLHTPECSILTGYNQEPVPTLGKRAAHRLLNSLANLRYLSLFGELCLF